MLYINGKQKPVSTIRSDIKKGATVSEFAQFFDVTAEIFLQRLEKRLPTETYAEYVEMMEDNLNRREKLSRKQFKSSESEKVVLKMPEEVMTETEDRAIMTDSAKEEVMVTPVNEEIDRVSELEAVISGCNNKIAELQSEVEVNKRESAIIENETEAIREQLKEYVEKVKIEQSKLTKLKSKKNQNEEAYNELSILLEEQNNILRNAMIELESYQKVTIALTNSSIELSKDGVEPLAEEIQDKFLVLSNNDEFADYTARNLRKAAEILCAIENIALLGLKYAVEYDTYETVREIVEKFLKIE